MENFTLRTIFLRHNHQEALKANLENETKDGFMVLQSALKSGNTESVTAVIWLLKKPGHEQALKDNLSGANRFGYNCLHQAANSCNYEYVQAVNSLIEHAYKYSASAIKQKLAKDRGKFKQSAWSTPQIKRYLYELSPSKPTSNYTVYFPSGKTQRKGSRRNDSQENLRRCNPKGRRY